MRTYTHLFDNVKQDWQAVAGVITSVCKTAKQQLPQLRQIHLRSDNAGCYKNGALLGYLPKIQKISGK